MDDNLEKLISRRSFLRRGSCAALGMGGLLAQLHTLRVTNAVLANTAFNDYRALVCLFMFGGNDSGNTLIPISGGNQNHSDYAASRGEAVSLPLDALGPTTITPTNGAGRSFALHPALSGVANLFDQGRAAVLANVGSLVEPLTLTTFRNATGERPPQLFAHNTQQELWQVSTADATGRIGWGGRVADVLQSSGANPDATVSMNISLAGTNFFLQGNRVSPYATGPGGAAGLSTAGLANADDERDAIQAAHADLIALQRNPDYSARNEISKAYADIVDRSLTSGDAITELFDRPTALTLPVPGTGLAQQLAAVARLIERGQSDLNHNRQVFFVSIGGFDTHDGLIGPHGNQLAQVNDALVYFWDALGQINMRNQVTTFTASDFGRTQVSNGDGSDHGWGGHHFILGGDQVDGGKLYGTYNDLTIDGSEDTGNGRYIPSTSVDAYSFELARWMGVPDSEMTTVFPNLTRFLDIADPSTHLGFMR